MKEAIEALFTESGVATPSHVEALKGIRSLADVTTGGIDEDAMDRLGFFLDDPEAVAQGEQNENRRALLLQLAAHLAPPVKVVKPVLDTQIVRPIIPLTQNENEDDEPGLQDPRKALLAAFGDVDIPEEEGENKEVEVRGERPQRENRRDQPRDERPRGRRQDRNQDREEDEGDDDREDNRRGRRGRNDRNKKKEKKEPQPPKPGIVLAKVDHLLARVHVDPLWIQVRDHIFGQIRIVRRDHSQASDDAYRQLILLDDALEHGQIMAERYPQNMRTLAAEMIKSLFWNKDIHEKEWFEKRYGALPPSPST